MPLLPIDQQAMFSHLDNVSKEQTVQKQGVQGNQALQAAELVKKAEQADNSITEAKNPDTGLEKIKDEKKELARKARERKKKTGSGEQTEKETAEPEVFKDPDLGHHIDIVG